MYVYCLGLYFPFWITLIWWIDDDEYILLLPSDYDDELDPGDGEEEGEGRMVNYEILAASKKKKSTAGLERKRREGDRERESGGKKK